MTNCNRELSSVHARSSIMSSKTPQHEELRGVSYGLPGMSSINQLRGFDL
jgi:hypothetical protein